MKIAKGPSQLVIETPRYAAEFTAGRSPVVRIRCGGQPLLDLPAVSGLATVDAAETLSAIRVGETRRAPGALTVTLTARSNLWSRRAFLWTFLEDRIEHRHSTAGRCRPGRCYFFSNGAAVEAPASRPDGVGAMLHAHRSFSPAANLADEYERMLGIPLSLGILPEVETPYAYGVPDRTAMIFAPPPLCLAFGRPGRWAGLGVGARPGEHRFNALEYSGVTHRGAFFFVNYLGSSRQDGFASPTAALLFGREPHAVLRAYAAWTDAQGFSTRRPFANALWHRRPVFCGWGEQGRSAERRGTRARDECTQARYEGWIRTLERRRLPFGTVVVDDKWQAAYGTFDVDTAKWPDMPGFVARQHRAGRHVLLWVPAYHAEGVPPELCVVADGRPVAADVSHPAYERYLRERIRRLVRDVGVDGFKVDWVWGIARRPGIRTHAPLHGIEWLRRFQRVLYEETHRWRPDAMVETHSAHPLFRESSDVLRLNDLHAGSRDIVRAMAERARIARLAGWPQVDCDASSDSLEEWWNYMRAQPAMGTPALYLVTGGSATWPAVPDRMWKELGRLWRRYVRSVDPRWFARWRRG